MRALLDFVRPPDDSDPKAMNRWRWNLSLSLLVCLMGMGYAYTPAGFAWAHDVEARVTKAVDAKLAPVVTEQLAQRATLDKVSAMLTEQLAASVASQIRLNISKRCKTTGFVEREELAREKDRLQDQYIAYKGGRYQEPACSDL